MGIFGIGSKQPEVTKTNKLRDILIDHRGKKFSYNGDNRLRAENQQLSLTPEQIQEIIRCKNDIIYFAEHYCYITDPNEGLKIIELWDFQKDLLRHYQANRFTLVLSPRQSSKSTTTSIFICWYVIFHNDKTVGMLANKLATAREIFGRVQDMFRLLPHFLKPAVIESNKTTLKLTNGCHVMASATTKSAMRGFTITGLLFLDEVAFIETTMFRSFFESVYPTISQSQTAKIIGVSTPNSMNHFYKMWTDSINGRNAFSNFRIYWQQVPGRDEKFKETTIKNIGEESWQAEYECEFLGRNSCLFTHDILKKQPVIDCTRKMIDNTLSIYEEPQKDHKYVVACDVGEGVGENFSTMNVIDVTSIPFRQVAVYKDNMIETTVLPKMIYQVGQMYNQALVIVERNSIGDGVVNDLVYDYEYPNMYADVDNKVGVKNKKNVKSIGNTTLKEVLDNNGITVCDFDTLKEMSNYVRHGASYRAIEGETDDIVIGLVLFAYVTKQTYFKEWVGDKQNIHGNIYTQKLKEIDDEMPVIVQVSGGEMTEIKGGRKNLYGEEEQGWTTVNDEMFDKLGGKNDWSD